MAQIFFFSMQGYQPMKDEALKAIARTHGWQAQGESWVYGVAIPQAHYTANEVADRLIALGDLVLPGIHDHNTLVDGQTQAALAQFGVNPGDKGIDVASKMAKVSGHPMLRPHFF